MSLETIADDHQVIGKLSSSASPNIPCPLSPHFEWVALENTPDRRFPRHILVTAALSAAMLDSENPIEISFSEREGAEILKTKLPGVLMQYAHELKSLAVAKRITSMSPIGIYTLAASKAREVLEPFLTKKC